VIQGIPTVLASLPEADLAEFCCKNTTVGVAVSLMHLMPQNTLHINPGITSIL
jgi:hypothetical protein